MNIGIDALYLSVSLVEQYAGRSKSGSATGFFFMHGERLFFVTNRHVLVDEPDHFFPDRIRLRLHTNPQNLRENDWYEVPLYENDQRRWLEYPQVRPYDLAFIELDRTVLARFAISPLTKTHLRPANVTVSLGDPLAVMGFPLGLYDRELNLPLIRSASLASPYPAPFQGQPYFLIDARLHEGISGAPVFLMNRGFRSVEGGIALGMAPHLLGVHSGTPFDSRGLTAPFDINDCWFAEIIVEALDVLRPIPAPPVVDTDKSGGAEVVTVPESPSSETASQTSA